jgi:hypothetical protein
VKLTLIALGHILTLTLEAAEPDAEQVEPHDTELDAYTERADHRDTNPAAELDHRTRMGFRP